MTTATTMQRSKEFSRPAARFDDDDNPASGTGQALEVRASAALNCRRSLWYAATGYVPTTNPPGEKSLMAMEAGNALESVVMRGPWKGPAGACPPRRSPGPPDGHGEGGP